MKLRKWTEEGRIKLVVSTILLSECARALKKAKWEDDLCGVDVIPVDRLVVKSAQNLVVNYDLYSADAIHAATAILTESHRRQIYYNNEEKYWLIKDMLAGEGGYKHKFDLYFHFAPMDLKEKDELV